MVTWNWLTTLFGGKGVKLTFDNSKHADGDISSTTSRNKQLDKSDHSAKSKSKSKDTYNGPVIHTQGPVNVVNGDVNIEIHVGTDASGTISAEGLTALAPLTGLFNKKQVAFLAESEKKTVTEIRSFENDDDTRGLLKFFRHRLKPNDFLRMRTGLYLKHLSDTARIDEVTRYWRQVTTSQSQRDRRIIELASADYFNTFFRPLFKQFTKANPETAQVRFTKEFDAILEDMRFAIFISSGKTVENIYDEVIKKAILNIKYGSNTEVISIHAAGKRQVSHVRAATVMLQDVFPVLTISSVPKSAEIIRVEIEYRKNNLDEELLQDDIAVEIT